MTELGPIDQGVPHLEASSEVRAGDADRDRVASVLGQALAEGRLTTVEHGERIDAVYTARTFGELAPLVRDLPATPTTPAAEAAVRATEQCTVHARLSKVVRAGRWVAGRHTRLEAAFGLLIVDLSDAVLPGREITLELNAFCAKLIVCLPDNVAVTDEGVNFASKRTVSASPLSENGAETTTVRITGTAKFSKLVVTQPRSGRGFPWTWSQRYDHH